MIITAIPGNSAQKLNGGLAEVSDRVEEDSLSYFVP